MRPSQRHLDFNAEVAAPGNENKMYWLVDWYINSHGETGPESEPLSFRII